MKSKRGLPKTIFVLMVLVFSILMISSVNAEEDKQIFDVEIKNITTNNDSNNLTIYDVSPSEGEKVNNPISVKFSVNYTNISNVKCTVINGTELPSNISLNSSENTEGIPIINISEKNDFPINLTRGDFEDRNYNYIIYCEDQNNSSKNDTIKEDFSVNENLTLEGLKETYTTEEDIVFNLPEGYNQGKITIGDLSFEIENKKINLADYSSLSLSTETYTLDITAYSEEGPDYKATREITIEEAGDTEPPEVDLIAPSNNKVINSTKVDFWFKAEDNVKLKNCTFELWNYTGPIEGEGILDYSKTFTKKLDKKKKVSLTKFKEVDHSWNVYCCDNSSNCNSEFDNEREFTVNLSDSNTASSTSENTTHNRSDEIESLQNALDSFMEKTEGYDSEKINSLEALGISKDLKYYQKQLRRIDKLLRKNFSNYREKEREEIKEETLQELEEMKGKIPKDITIKESKEYVKNTITNDLADILGRYVEAKDREMDEKRIEKLAEFNKEQQNRISISTKVSQLTIEYNQTEEDKEATLVQKKINFQNESDETLIEFIPEEISSKEIEFFIDDYDDLSENIYEIKKKDLKNNSLIYTIEGHVEPEKIKDTQTILFKYSSESMSGITGFFALDINGDPGNFFLFLVISIIVIYLAYRAYKNYQISNWKKYPNVVRTTELIKKAKNDLRFNDLNSARENYHKIRKTFPLLPEGFKKYIANDVKKIRIGIDKRDISGMVKEYENAKRQGRKEDANALYNKIKSVYKRLPEKYRQKVYERMFKPQIEF